MLFDLRITGDSQNLVNVFPLNSVLQVILQGIMLRLLLVHIITICVLITIVKCGVPIGK